MGSLKYRPSCDAEQNTLKKDGHGDGQDTKIFQNHGRHSLCFYNTCDRGRVLRRNDAEMVRYSRYTCSMHGLFVLAGNDHSFNSR